MIFYRSLLITLSIVSGFPLIALGNCPTPGEWWQAEGPVAHSDLLTHASQQQVVLLGEQHDAAEHHRWQLSTLAGLYALRDDMVIGLEMLPRSAQTVLDRWVAGSLSEQELLEQSQWQEVWGFDAELYLPILHFARQQRIPLLALNITPELRQRLSEEGFEHVPPEQRHHLPTPMPPKERYQTRLQDIFEQHGLDTEDSARLKRFIDAQVIWDLAMAHPLAESAHSGTLAVGLMGMGHTLYGDGVPHQLNGMGIEHIFSLLPWEQQACNTPEALLADAVFILAPKADASDHRER